MHIWINISWITNICDLTGHGGFLGFYAGHDTAVSFPRSLQFWNLLNWISPKHRNNWKVRPSLGASQSTRKMDKLSPQTVHMLICIGQNRTIVCGYDGSLGGLDVAMCQVSTTLGTDSARGRRRTVIGTDGSLSWKLHKERREVRWVDARNRSHIILRPEAKRSTPFGPRNCTRTPRDHRSPTGANRIDKLIINFEDMEHYMLLKNWISLINELLMYITCRTKCLLEILLIVNLC